MLTDPSRESPHRFAFVLIPEFSLMPVSAAIEPLRLANRAMGNDAYDWSFHTLSGKPVAASSGIEISPDGDLDAITARATVTVCGGINVARHADKPLLSWLRRHARLGGDIGSLCTGCHILAKAGLLNGYACTIHWENMPAFQEEFPQINVSGNLIEIDRDRFTCAGGTAPVDMMLSLIAAQHGESVASDVAEQIIHAPIRRHAEHQRLSLPARIGSRHPKLVKIIETMQENLEDPLSPAELTRQVNLSTRQLERLFRRYLDRSPRRYYLELRLKKARLLLLQTDMSVMNVALACGFTSASHFSKCYRAFHGRTPYRERGTIAAVPRGD